MVHYSWALEWTCFLPCCFAFQGLVECGTCGSGLGAGTSKTLKGGRGICPWRTTWRLVPYLSGTNLMQQDTTKCRVCGFVCFTRLQISVNVHVHENFIFA